MLRGTKVGVRVVAKNFSILKGVILNDKTKLKE